MSTSVYTGDKEHVVFVSKYYCTTTHGCDHFSALPNGPAEGEGGVSWSGHGTGEALNYAQVLGNFTPLSYSINVDVVITY